MDPKHSICASPALRGTLFVRRWNAVLECSPFAPPPTLHHVDSVSVLGFCHSLAKPLASRPTQQRTDFLCLQLS